MNFIEAIKSGNRIRRSSWSGSIDVSFLMDEDESGEYLTMFSTLNGNPLSKTDILAEDWEVKEMPEAIGKIIADVIKAAADLHRLVPYDGTCAVRDFANDRLGIALEAYAKAMK